MEKLTLSVNRFGLLYRIKKSPPFGRPSIKYETNEALSTPFDSVYMLKLWCACNNSCNPTKTLKPFGWFFGKYIDLLKKST